MQDLLTARLIENIKRERNHNNNNNNNKGKNKDLKKNLLLLSISILIGIIILEILFTFAYPQRLIFNDCFYDDLVKGNQLREVNLNYGWFTSANYIGCNYQPDTGEKIYHKHNSKGLRLEQEIDYEKPKGIKRMIIFGDSFVYGQGLDQNETQAYYLQQLLGSEWEVIPFGVSGYGTDQSFIVFGSEGIKYDPDVVLFYHFQNDYSDSIQSNVQLSADKPFFQYNEGNFNLELKNYPTQGLSNFMTREKYVDSFGGSFKLFFARYSHIYAFFNTREKILQKKPYLKYNYTAHIEANKQNIGFKVPGDSTSWGVEKEQHTFMKEAYRIVMTILDLGFKDISKSENYEFIVINIPHKIHVNEDSQKKWIAQFSDVDENYFDFYNIGETFIKDLEEKNINYVDLKEVARDNFDEFYFIEDIHWSNKGSKISANYIYENLKKQGIINSEPYTNL